MQNRLEHKRIAQEKADILKTVETKKNRKKNAKFTSGLADLADIGRGF